MGTSEKVAYVVGSKTHAELRESYTILTSKASAPVHGWGSDSEFGGSVSLSNILSSL